MPGPPPKRPELRQRRNKATTSAMLTVDAPKRKRAPRLPTVNGVEWHAMTRAWWHDVWHSPMAEEYLEADIHALFRLAVLVNEYWLKLDPKLAAEIRLQQQAFGLTPIDRRRLQWEVEKAESLAGRKGRGSREPNEATDPRDVLKVLK